ncbi:hypothetical protein K469DRAFT_682690 [Zopfia rhizophila CBS 207.26]|uniref:Uncharacterized protein n=1 Tax=Zopfia rhizophila CBS 207.26 TaxID=1314779 RepID=A0A6A6DCW5_9PEZI|nr:hypothetical protein K469DRAFT_682690 [Zopfia rhizophila CBS 207.26]
MATKKKSGTKSKSKGVTKVKGTKTKDTKVKQEVDKMVAKQSQAARRKRSMLTVKVVIPSHRPVDANGVTTARIRIKWEQERNESAKGEGVENDENQENCGDGDENDMSTTEDVVMKEKKGKDADGDVEMSG